MLYKTISSVFCFVFFVLFFNFYLFIYFIYLSIYLYEARQREFLRFPIEGQRKLRQAKCGQDFHYFIWYLLHILKSQY